MEFYILRHKQFNVIIKNRNSYRKDKLYPCDIARSSIGNKVMEDISHGALHLFIDSNDAEEAKLRIRSLYPDAEFNVFRSPEYERVISDVVVSSLDELNSIRKSLGYPPSSDCIEMPGLSKLRFVHPYTGKPSMIIQDV